MYFHTGIEEYVMFESCHTDTVTDLILACVVVFFTALVYEGLKFVPEAMHGQGTSSKQLQSDIRSPSASYSSNKDDVIVMSSPRNNNNNNNNGQEDSVAVRDPSKSKPETVTNQILSGRHTAKSFLHIVQVTLVNCLMLVAMTFNLWLCLSVLLGAGAGFLLHHWLRLRGVRRH